jgi:hypothetical protein
MKAAIISSNQRQVPGCLQPLTSTALRTEVLRAQVNLQARVEE